MTACPASVCAPSGFHRQTADRVVARLERSSDPDERAAGADDGHERAQAPSGLLPQFRSRPQLVSARVRGVGELIGAPRAQLVDELRGSQFDQRQILAADLARRSPGRLRHQLDLGAVGREQLTPLLAVALAHHGDHAVTHDRAGDGQTDAHVAAGQLDDDHTGAKTAIQLRITQTLQRRAILDASAGIHRFQLEQDAARKSRREPIEPDSGSSCR